MASLLPGGRAFFTDAEVAELLRVRPRTVEAWRLSGRLSYLRGRPPLVARADLERFLASRRAGATVDTDTSTESVLDFDDALARLGRR